MGLFLLALLIVVCVVVHIKGWF